MTLTKCAGIDQSKLWMTLLEIDRKWFDTLSHSSSQVLYDFPPLYLFTDVLDNVQVRIIWRPVQDWDTVPIKEGACGRGNMGWSIVLLKDKVFR